MANEDDQQSDDILNRPVILTKGVNCRTSLPGTATFNGRVRGPMLRLLGDDQVMVRIKNAEDFGLVDSHAATGEDGGAEFSTAAPGEHKALCGVWSRTVNWMATLTDAFNKRINFKMRYVRRMEPTDVRSLGEIIRTQVQFGECP